MERVLTIRYRRLGGVSRHAIRYGYSETVNLPEAWTERLPFLEPLENDWEPVARWMILCWLGFYGLFLLQLFRATGVLTMIDLVFVPIHEGGHLLFSYCGRTMMIAGGTVLQLFVPLTLAASFALRRQIPGTAFCLFCFFEQFLPIARYMADARSQELPLLTVGDAEYVEHDWAAMFGGMGVLQHDTQIAAAVRTVGWIGMFGTVVWLAWRGFRSKSVAKEGHIC
jgi:hypothetical protein